jgi:hypothetical protein
MNMTPRTIKIIRKSLDALLMLSSVIRAGDRLKKGNLSPKEEEKALDILARYRDGVDQQARPEQTVNPVSTKGRA